MAHFSQDVVAKAREFDRESAALKTRVHQLAKALGLTSKETIAALGHAGIVVKSAASTINQNQLGAVLDFISSADESASRADGDVVAEPTAEKPTPDKDAAAASASEAESSERNAEESKAPAKKKARNKAPAKKKSSAKKGAPAKKKSSAKKGAAARKDDSAPKPQTEPAQRADTERKNAGFDPGASTEATEVAETGDADVENTTRTGSSRRGRRTRRAVRVSGASRSVPFGDKEREDSTAADEPDFSSQDNDSLEDIEPPATPEPPVTEEQAAYAPLFLAPHAAVVESNSEKSDSTADSGQGNSEQDSEDTSQDASERTSESDGGAQLERQPRPRRRRRGRGRRADDSHEVQRSGDDRDSLEAVEEVEEPQAIKGSTRLEAQRRRRIERREESRKRHVISEAEFLARRESVERTMVVRERKRHDHAGIVTEVGVLEDDLLVEHFVTSDTQTTQIGNVYLGRVQNVLPSMEAAFIDIGTDRNGVIYVGDLNWKLLGTKSRSRKIEHALKAGDQILVQVSKDPIGHKGARLTMHISLAGRFLVYVPGGRSAGISRKLPENERKRLKAILSEVTPEGSGTIIRTAAEGVSKEAIEADIERLRGQWQKIWDASENAKAKRGAKPITLYQEPDMLVKVVRDVFNEDFSRLVVEGDRPWNTVTDYVGDLAPELEPRLQRYFASEHGGVDVFEHFRIDEQLAKALDRKVWLPSGGTLIIDRTEAMTVIDVNTGKFTGSGGNLEETVTRNNLEAAEEIVRQMRLRDLGGMIVVDFIDMVLPENQDLVLRRLKEALGRDRSRHEVSEVTSLGLVQMTRKRLGTGLLETFSTPCEYCRGRGLKIHIDPVEHDERPGHREHGGHHEEKATKKRRRHASLEQDPAQHPAAVAMHRHQREQEGADFSHALDDASVHSQQELDDADRRVAAAVEAVVVSSERDEPKPPRRRRRAQRRSEPANASNHAEWAGRKGRDDASEDLAAVAAAAVAEAREADPEEPSDDRYVSQPARRRRRATRRRVAEHVAVDSAAHDSGKSEGRDDFEHRNDSDARGDNGRRQSRIEESDRKEQPSREGSEHSTSASARRRRRRATRRLYEDHAEEKRDGQQQEPVEQSYEEAVEAFEASPRRRRPTRGKSRSDRAPRREDFERPQSAPKSAEDRASGREDNSATQTEAEAASTPVTGSGASDRQSDFEVVMVHGIGARRNRRRAVRRASSASTDKAGSSKRTSTSGSTRKVAKSGGERQTASEATGANPRRRVRRAVRKSSRN